MSNISLDVAEQYLPRTRTRRLAACLLRPYIDFDAVSYYFQRLLRIMQQACIKFQWQDHLL